MVNDPNKPIIRKYFKKFSEKFFTYPRETKYPIRKDPMIFTDKVA